MAFTFFSARHTILLKFYMMKFILLTVKLFQRLFKKVRKITFYSSDKLTVIKKNE